MQTIAGPEAEALTAGFRIGALRGVASAEIQGLLARFAERRIREGLRVAGVIEELAVQENCRHCETLVLREAAGSTIVPITQNLGSGSRACNIDTAGLAAACQSVLAGIERGADVVVLSKFGKIEAEGGGLLDAFRAAAEADLPCVAGIKPSFAGHFLEFAGGLSQWVEPDDEALERWWAGRGG